MAPCTSGRAATPLAMSLFDSATVRMTCFFIGFTWGIGRASA